MYKVSLMVLNTLYLILNTIPILSQDAHPSAGTEC